MRLRLLHLRRSSTVAFFLISMRFWGHVLIAWFLCRVNRQNKIGCSLPSALRCRILHETAFARLLDLQTSLYLVWRWLIISVAVFFEISLAANDCNWTTFLSLRKAVWVDGTHQLLIGFIIMNGSFFVCFDRYSWLWSIILFQNGCSSCLLRFVSLSPLSCRHAQSILLLLILFLLFLILLQLESLHIMLQLIALRWISGFVWASFVGGVVPETPWNFSRVV